MPIGIGGIAFIATLSDAFTSLCVFFLGNKIKGNKTPKKTIKWRNK